MQIKSLIEIVVLFIATDTAKIVVNSTLLIANKKFMIQFRPYNIVIFIRGGNVFIFINNATPALALS